MCIALLSTAHPAYKFILVTNRDEFLNRPTASASWWPQPNSHVLGGRDLQRAEQGTWLAVTKHGRIAVLTNFRDDSKPASGSISRGAITRAFLTRSHSSTEAFAKETLLSDLLTHAGGFSLICGQMGKPLAVISNSSSSESPLDWLAPHPPHTVGLSNAAFHHRGWKKVMDGEQGLKDAIDDSVRRGDSEDVFLDRLLQLLSTDTMSRDLPTGDQTALLDGIKNTILVPPLRIATTGSISLSAATQGPDGANLYATQKQTVILADHADRVRFFERTLYDSAGGPIPNGQGDREFTFNVEADT